ncbi:hypothetical protein MMC25_007225 [Agyrium rufum]|nr:hypothetical protein [Agyrium rufum]
MTASTSYTPVLLRQGFDRPPTNSDYGSQRAPPSNPMPPAPVATERPKTVWPESVRQYVQRSFAVENTIDGIPKTELEAKLKDVISKAAEGQRLYSIEWETLPLPQQMIRQERLDAEASSWTATQNWGDRFSTLHVEETNNISPGSLSKKRKILHQATPSVTEKIPPWRTTPGRNIFEDRLSFPDKKPRTSPSNDEFSKSSDDAESRYRRFETSNRGSLAARTTPAQATDPPEPQGPVIGRCQTLEKRYFRLTSAPNADDVRPLPVLRKTLDLLKKKWKSENNYSYICDQFKSLRQDLTVQHIKNDFTVNVYEIHARIALEKGDLGEYNQCQTQLRSLYKQNLGGHPIEFKAYRILYFIHTCNRTDMNDVLADLTPTEKQSLAVKHALDTRSALALGNYHRFFQLYLNTPNMGAYLMDMFVARERLSALANICKGYKNDVKLRFIAEELAFNSDEEAARFICDRDGQAFLENSDGIARLLTAKVGPLFETAAVAARRKVDIKGQI